MSWRSHSLMSVITLYRGSRDPTEYEKRFYKLLIAKAGDVVVVSQVEETHDELKRFHNRGYFVSGDNPYLAPGEPCHCHANVSFLWEESVDFPQEDPVHACAIATGYALSVDGLWRQHSWGIARRDRRPIETTVERVLYFGYELDAEEAKEFHENNAF